MTRNGKKKRGNKKQIFSNGLREHCVYKNHERKRAVKSESLVRFRVCNVFQFPIKYFSSSTPVHILLLGFIYKSQLFQFPANRRLFGIRCTHKHLLLHWNSAETDIWRKTNRCWFPSLSKSLVYEWWKWIFFFFSYDDILYLLWNFSWNLDFFESNFRGDEKSIDFSMDFDFVSF